MGLWKCLNENCADPITGKVGCVFESDQPVCPSCATDQRKPPGHFYIAKVEIVHFDPPSQIKGRGKNHIACNPRKSSTSGVRATGAHSAVTCKQCKDSEIFQRTKPEDEPTLVHDLLVKVDKDGKVTVEEKPDEFQEAGCCG